MCEKDRRTLRGAREFYHDFLGHQVRFFGVRPDEDVERGEEEAEEGTEEGKNDNKRCRGGGGDRRARRGQE